jgi:ATP-dependent DNA helicase RecQ
LLDPIERGKSFERVEDGSASLLYISPESLRSKTIERLLLGRKIVRFVIDEAHCFSSWGQDFRVDYLYIGDFIKQFRRRKISKNNSFSCFTATAKKKVIEDICAYFRRELSLILEVFQFKCNENKLAIQSF